MAKQNVIQRNMAEVDKIHKEFGGRRPDFINMYYAVKIRSLTRVLIWLTGTLSFLTLVLIVVEVITVLTGVKYGKWG